MDKFTGNLDDLVNELNAAKYNLTRYIKKNYKLNIHYIVTPGHNNRKQGGHNRIIYLLREDIYNLLKNTYNMRNRYIVDINDNIKCVNIGMCIENQTIGFIENSFKGITDIKRQYIMGKYRLDMYFVEYKLAIECDENDHADRNETYELERQAYIIAQGNQIIRFNPNEQNFDLSNVLNAIYKVIFQSTKKHLPIST
jgi:very-short-patch-repair endonuclease